MNMPNNTMNANSPDLFVGESEPKIRGGIVKQVIPEKGEKMETKDVTVKPRDFNDLVALVADKPNGVEIIRDLIAMKNAEEDRSAKHNFDLHFTEMQADFVAVYRSKQGYGYKYAPIEDLQEAYGPTIAKHGFSYRWREEAVATGKRVILVISGYGHFEETYIDIPTLEKTKQMNSVQAVGGMSTYGRRYTFIAGFGVIIKDEDDDAKNAEGKPETAADKEFNNILTYALKEKIGVYKNTWDTSDESEKRTVYKNIRQDIFDKLVESMEPDRVKSYRELWNKPGNKNQDYIDILEGIKAVKQ
jgi:hypothetical protein